MVGPSSDIDDEAVYRQWDNTSPYDGETATMIVTDSNLGGNGMVEFALQELVEGGYWSTSSMVGVEVTSGQSLTASLPVSADAPQGTAIEYRVLVLVDGVEMDRQSVESLLIKEETVRDGEALSQQLSDDIFSVTLFIIALTSLSFGMYALVLRRRMLAPETEEEAADQTEEVVQEMVNQKVLPSIASPTQPPSPPVAPAPPAPSAPPAPAMNRSSPPPLPPTGLPDGWTEDQWTSYGWQYIDALSKK